RVDWKQVHSGIIDTCGPVRNTRLDRTSGCRNIHPGATVEPHVSYHPCPTPFSKSPTSTSGLAQSSLSTVFHSPLKQAKCSACSAPTEPEKPRCFPSPPDYFAPIAEA